MSKGPGVDEHSSELQGVGLHDIAPSRLFIHARMNCFTYCRFHKMPWTGLQRHAWCVVVLLLSVSV